MRIRKELPHVATVIGVAQERPAPEPHVEEGRAGQEGVGESVAPEGFVPHRIEVSESSTGEEGDLHPPPASLRAGQLSIAHGESASQGTVGDSQMMASKTVVEEPPPMIVPEGVIVVKPGPLGEARFASLAPSYTVTNVPPVPSHFSRFPQYLADVLGNDHGSSYNPRTVTAAYLFQSIRPDYPPDAFVTEALAQEYVRRETNSAWFPFLPRPTMTKALLEGVNNSLADKRRSIRPTNLEEVYMFDLSIFRAHAILE
ncbi:hypothetical protein R1sor_003395 [Riccia sorocarpa]|uniref:Uncharacterized protein n=1 Tax=Riccia sorocarpa TaxID=122646 RepID=A0ABD3H2A9_9MARC